MNKLEKPWFRSKKFLALAMLATMTTGLICAAILTRVNPDVLQSMVTILGGGTAASAGGFIGAQGYVDSKVRPLLIQSEEIVEEEIIEKPES